MPSRPINTPWVIAFDLALLHKYPYSNFLLQLGQIAVDRAAPQDEMANSPYMTSASLSSIPTGGAGGPMRGSNGPLGGGGYGNLPGNLEFNSGVSSFSLSGCQFLKMFSLFFGPW